MKIFVFWTGVYNIVAGIGLFFPALFHALGVRFPVSVVWTELIGFLVVFLGLMLIWCSRDLAARGQLVYWDGVLRLVVFLHMGWFGFFGDTGPTFGAIGVIDGLIGLGYLLGLPKATGRGHASLMWDLT